MALLLSTSRFPSASSLIELKGPAWADADTDTDTDTPRASAAPSSEHSWSPVRSPSPSRERVRTPSPASSLDQCVSALPPGVFFAPVFVPATCGTPWGYSDDAPSCSSPEVPADFAGDESSTATPCSVGSRGHPYSCGPACKYESKSRGCKDGAECTHCHLCLWSSKKYAKSRRQRRKAAARRSEEEVAGDSDDDASS